VGSEVSQGFARVHDPWAHTQFYKAPVADNDERPRPTVENVDSEHRRLPRNRFEHQLTQVEFFDRDGLGGLPEQFDRIQ